MANYNALYKKLHEEFKLEFNEDFWQHKQSGKYIITHNAVKKIAAQQRKKGLTIETPKANDWKILSQQVGPHGREIVMAGEVLNTATSIGEANEKNCRLAFMWTMAEKRMYDRGVLSLLQIAELGGYSDIEADDFAKAKNTPKKPPAQEKPKTWGKEHVQSAPRPKPPMPPSPPGRLAPKISAPKVNEEQPEDKEPVSGDKCLELVLSYIKENDTESTGMTIGQIGLVMYESGENFDVKEALTKGIKDGLIAKEGQKRGTRYSLAPTQGENASQLSEEEYTQLWRQTNNELKELGLSYQQVTEIVYKVTGHDTAIAAFRSGELQPKHFAEMKSLGMLNGTT